MKGMTCVMVLAVVLLSACAGGAKRVDCTWRLEPINAAVEQVHGQEEQEEQKQQKQEQGR